MKRNGKDNRDSRHELSDDFVRMLSDDWQRNGKAALEKVREQDPRGYCELVGKIVPKEMLLASDKSPRPNEPQTSKEIADMLLLSSGITEPTDEDRQRALALYDEMNIRLDEIAAEKGLQH